MSITLALCSTRDYLCGSINSGKQRLHHPTKSIAISLALCSTRDYLCGSINSGKQRLHHPTKSIALRIYYIHVTALLNFIFGM